MEVVFCGERYIRNPKSRYYFKYTTKNAERRNARQLHRAIWEYYNGPIPPGFHIHHIDGNIDNNDISNLLCIEGKAHLSGHARANLQNPEYAKKHEEQFAKCRALASDWHGSEAGIEYHKKHFAESLAKANLRREKVCEFCGRTYQGTSTQRFCSDSCQQKARRRRLGLKFEPSERICDQCGERYMPSKANQRFCCGACKTKYRNQHKGD